MEAAAVLTSEQTCRDWTGHVVVCGLNPVGLRTVEQLHLAGARVVVLDDDHDERLASVVRGWSIPYLRRSAHLAEPLFDAGLAGAGAVVCAESDDLRTLETVLLIRDLRPDVRIVADLDNPSVSRAVEDVMGAVGVLDVAALFAPSVVEVCMGRRARDIRLGESLLVATEVQASRSGTLREIYGSLAPIGIMSEGDEEPVACPGRDEAVRAGDRVTLLGTHAELAAAGIDGPAAMGLGADRATARARSAAHRVASTLRELLDGGLGIALALGLLLLITSTLVLHFGYQRSGQTGSFPVLEAVYFTVETVATVGFGDFSFSGQSTGIEAFGIFLIIAGTTLVTTMFALLTNALVSRRIALALGRERIPGMRGHVVLVGLGAVGMQVLDGLLARGRDVVVVERAESNPFVGQARDKDVPVVIGDATMSATLDAANLGRAGAVAILTSDDLTNIETGLAVRSMLEGRWSQVPVVLRVFDRQMGRRLEVSFGFHHVWSTSALAAPWFVGAVLGMDVLLTFYVGSHPFLLASLRISEDGGLDGLAMRDLPARIRVVAISRAGSARMEHPPRRDTLLARGDEAFLVGPYAELLQVLRHDREGAGASLHRGRGTGEPGARARSEDG